MTPVLLTILFAYLLGAIPFGLLVSRLYGVSDLRQIGSGNIGATNVWRAAGPGAAVWVYILDIGKGVLAISLAHPVSQTVMSPALFMTLVALAAVLGHIFPVYLRFRGGKGVNTALGVLIMTLPVETLVAIVLFAIVVGLTKYISLGSLVAALSLPAVIFVEALVAHKDTPAPYVVLALLLSLAVVFTHLGNIKRLIAGTENRFSFSPGNSGGAVG